MKNPSAGCLLFSLVAFFILAGSGLIYGQNLRKGPYLLYDNNNTQMEVLWQTDATSTDLIQWGTDQTYGGGNANSVEYGSDHQHKYIITSLAPGTKYYYLVTIAGNSYSGSFYTAPLASQTSLKFFAYGDTRTNVSIHNQVAGLINEVYTNDQAYQTFILSVGDLVADGNQETYWTNEFFNLSKTSIQQMIANLPLLACRGNHEGTGVIFLKYFPYPYQEDYYWSFDYGPAHFAIVDQYIAYNPGSTQYTWLQNDLAGSTKPWKFIYLHEPGWSAAGGHPNNTEVQQYIEPLCEQFNIAILFAGHNHYYARALVNGTNGTSVQHITCAGGGAPLYIPDLSQPNIVTASSTYHYCKINIISNDQLEFQAVSITGAVIDQFIIDRNPATVPNVPGGSVSKENEIQKDREKYGFSIYPNPCISTTTLGYTLTEKTSVEVSVIDIHGEEMILAGPGKPEDPGNHEVTIDCTDLPRGPYLCKLTLKTNSGIIRIFSNKIMLIK
jgi:hypothetical protein